MFETGVPSSESEAGTRERLLEAAGEVFAEVGYVEATIREISKRAGANLAAINYHFGSKERLYAEVLKYADELTMRRHPEFREDLRTAEPEVQLRFFIEQFLRRILDTGGPGWHEKVMSRELLDPTLALEELAEKNIKPRAVLLQQIVRNLMLQAGGGSCPQPSDRDVQLCAASVVGQCMLYHKGKVFLKHLMPEIPLKESETVEVLAGHITAFSIAAIAAKAGGEFSMKTNQIREKRP